MLYRFSGPSHYIYMLFRLKDAPIKTPAGQPRLAESTEAALIRTISARTEWLNDQRLFPSLNGNNSQRERRES